MLQSVTLGEDEDERVQFLFFIFEKERKDLKMNRGLAGRGFFLFFFSE